VVPHGATIKVTCGKSLKFVALIWKVYTSDEAVTWTNWHRKRGMIVEAHVDQ
jgi:hypothetical protein